MKLQLKMAKFFILDSWFVSLIASSLVHRENKTHNHSSTHNNLSTKVPILQVLLLFPMQL